MSRNEHKEPSLENEKGCPITRRKESRKQTRLGAEGGLGRGALKERDEVQGELLKALGAKNNKPIKTNHVPLAPSRAETLSSAKLNWKQHTPGLRATKADWWE